MANFRQRIDTTYADLRPTDLVIDKSGQAWPIADLDTSVPHSEQFGVTFMLCDPVSKVRMHFVRKDRPDAVKVSRLPTQADEAAKLEADFPSPSVEVYVEAQRQIKSIGASDEDADEAAVFVAKYLQDETVIFPGSPTDEAAKLEADFPVEDTLDADGSVSELIAILEEPTMAEAVAAVEEIGGTVEAEVTAAEVDAAAAATDDAPVSLPHFADMTPLEQRSHLYLLHGLYGSDVTGKAELIAIHDQAHAQHDAGTLQSRHVPHVHQEA